MTVGVPESNQIMHVDLGYVWKRDEMCNGALHIARRCDLPHIRAITHGRFVDVQGEVSRAGYTGG